MSKYTPSAETLAWLDNVFAYHPSHGDQGPRYEHIRGVAREYARELVQSCPPSPELDQALWHLRQAVMFGNCAIAFHEAPCPPAPAPQPQQAEPVKKP